MKRASLSPLAALSKVLAACVLAAPAAPAGEPSLLARRNYTTSTSNQLTDGTACRAVTVVYARGTWEAGNVGAPDEPGVATFNDLAALLGEDHVALQGVDYPANMIGFEIGGDPGGSRLMANLTALVGRVQLSQSHRRDVFFLFLAQEGGADKIIQASTQCPDTKLVLSG